MRARVEALLASYDAAEHFLEHSPMEEIRPPREAQPGDVIGPYTLIRKIGAGGCGIVYLAEQTEPLRRKAALKVIKLGMDTENVIARFEAERQALAMMDHPDIARVFDAGATATGRPYFVMEYVDGLPITRFADEHSLSMEDRLELFARVCLALQHAHQKGIIHRDLKPSNVLVALHDGVPSPKVIDFGIAKATQGRLTDGTLLTAPEFFLGTPAYMSPEQAEGGEGDIDTRSDVYSLGVLLYELMTGRPPFDPKSLQQAGLDEMRRIIREVDPPRPSTRFSTLSHADSATVAKVRGSAPPQLSSILRGDLDWIVMRCLEKQRDRRYPTAQDLAADVRRHLHREPVVARPPSFAYRGRKFVSRHRLACASVAAVSISLILGTIVSVAQAVRATRAERVARLERANAQRRQAEAEGLLTFMLGDFRGRLKKIGQLGLLDDVGEKALAHFAALDPRDLTDAELLNHVRTLRQIGEIRTDEARYADAIKAFQAAYDRAVALVARTPRAPDPLFERAQAEYWIGFAARQSGDDTSARTWLTRYRDSALALAALEGQTPRAEDELSYGHHNLAVLDLDHRNLAAARRGFLDERHALEEMLAAKPDDTELGYRLADNASWLGNIAETDGDFPEAIARFREMARRTQALVAREPSNPRWQLGLSRSATLLGGVQSVSGQPSEARQSYARARGILDRLVSSDPKNQQWLLAQTWVRLLQVRGELTTDEYQEAAGELAAIHRLLDGFRPATTSSLAINSLLAADWRLEARWRLATKRPDAADAAARAIAIGESLVHNRRADRYAFTDLARNHLLAGRIAALQSDAGAATAHWKRALELVSPELTGPNDWRILEPAAEALILLGHVDRARPLVQRLTRIGFRPPDPLTASTLEVANRPDKTTVP